MLEINWLLVFGFNFLKQGSCKEKFGDWFKVAAELEGWTWHEWITPEAQREKTKLHRGAHLHRQEAKVILQGIFPSQGLNQVSRIAGRRFTLWATREALVPQELSALTKPQVFAHWLMRTGITRFCVWSPVIVPSIFTGFREFFNPHAFSFLN